ncbi:hypothetical protein FDG2_1354 [Candidatus Protofrankia californiensis]|uniref:Uncharacterized protein n=1 Tax=Candidatus Protofrankia californiensis TaxID=1839754 RepID=A0A1C3NVE2_9ACTN|nr:hypothetical protein FDG2_1354 [Candidatus Protofrankia californiensis]
MLTYAQHFPIQAAWEHDDVRAGLRDYVVEHPEFRATLLDH